MTKDGAVKQRQHFYHHGDTICHPRSGYETTKLYGTSTCGRNNNTIFSEKKLFSLFLPASYAGGHVDLATASLDDPKWKDGSTVEFIIFRVQNLLSGYIPCLIL